MDKQDMPERVWVRATEQCRDWATVDYYGGTEYVRADLARQPSEADVERVARAICLQEGKKPDQKSHNSFEWWRHYAPHARAALASIGGNHA